MLKLVTIDQVDPWGMTLAEIKDAIYVTGSDYDSLISSIAKTAREYSEGRIWKQIIPASYVLYLDSFPDLIELPKPPIIAVASIKYYDTNDTLQTFSSSLYQVDLYSDPCRIKPVSGQDWPDVYDRLNAVEVAFTCGFDDSDDRHTLPENIKTAQKMLIKHLYDNRSSIMIGEGRTLDVKEIPLSTNYLLDMESARQFV